MHTNISPVDLMTTAQLNSVVFKDKINYLHKRFKERSSKPKKISRQRCFHVFILLNFAQFGKEKVYICKNAVHSAYSFLSLFLPFSRCST